MGIPVVKWHGDAPQAEKKRAMSKPQGIALITPKSIEAMFTTSSGRRHASVVDGRVHRDRRTPFVSAGTAGTSLASLLRRIDAMSQRPARRVGLSATIGDLPQAAAWLRPDAAPAASRSWRRSQTHRSSGCRFGDTLSRPNWTIRITLRALGCGGNSPTDRARRYRGPSVRDSSRDEQSGLRRVATTVESAADRLRRRCEKAKVPNEFFPHHGSLSKTLREELEDRLKDAKAAYDRDLHVDLGTGRRHRIREVGGSDRIAEIVIFVKAASRTDRPSPWDAVDPSGLRARAEYRPGIRHAGSVAAQYDPIRRSRPATPGKVRRAGGASSGNGVDAYPSDTVCDRRTRRNTGATVVRSIVRSGSFRLDLGVRIRRFASPSLIGDGQVHRAIERRYHHARERRANGSSSRAISLPYSSPRTNGG